MTMHTFPRLPESGIGPLRHSERDSGTDIAQSPVELHDLMYQNYVLLAACRKREES